MMVYRNYSHDQLEAQFVLDSVSQLDVLFEKRLKRSANSRTRLEPRLDVRYGTHKNQTLDIFLDKTVEQNGCIHMFIHGGFWHSLDAKTFSFVADGFCGDGTVVIVVDYPMFPDVNFQIIVDSCQRAIHWIYEHGSELNVDPNRITISGNSAGGHLVTLLMNRDWPLEKNLPVDVVSAGCAISGLYDLEPVRQSTKNKILCMSKDDVHAYSPIHNIPREAGELLFIVGENETDEFLYQQVEIADSWSKAGLQNSSRVVPNRNHIDIVMDELALNGSEINRMVKNLITSS